MSNAIVLSKELLVRIFELWDKKYENSPEEFDTIEECKETENRSLFCADYFLELFEEIKLSEKYG